MLGIGDMLLRFFGVGVAGRIRFIMMLGIVIGLVGIVLGLVRGHTGDLVVGVVVLVTSALFWPWLIRTGRRRGTV